MVSNILFQNRLYYLKWKEKNFRLSYNIIILRNVVYIHVNPLLISHGTYIMLTVCVKVPRSCDTF